MTNRERWPNILVLGASFQTHNLGVGALTAGTLETILKVFPEAAITLLDYGPRPFQFRYGDNPAASIDLVNLRFSKRFLLENNVARLLVGAWVGRLLLGRFRQKSRGFGNSTLETIARADLAVSLSGGDSFSDIYGTERLLYVCLPQLLVLALKKPLILLPQTLGPFKGPLAKMLAGYIMRRASLIYSRDFLGLEKFGSAGDDQTAGDKVRFCYDVGFALNPVKPNQLEVRGFSEDPPPSFLVGLNVSGLLFRGGYSGRNDFGLKCSYPSLMEQVIEDLVTGMQGTVMLVPHVLGEDEDSESDSVVCRVLYEKLRPRYGEKICLVRGRYDQSQIKYLIGRCQFFVGSRMHACIAAVSQNIPTVSIAYSQKFKGVMKTIGVEHLVADPRTMGQDEILALIRGALEDREATRRHLQAKIPEVRRRVLGLFHEIAAAGGIPKNAPERTGQRPLPGP